MRSKFKLRCVPSKNSYIILIDVINLKLRLINVVYFFKTPGSLLLKIYDCFTLRPNRCCPGCRNG